MTLADHLYVLVSHPLVGAAEQHRRHFCCGHARQRQGFLPGIVDDGERDKAASLGLKRRPFGGPNPNGRPAGAALGHNHCIAPSCS